MITVITARGIGEALGNNILTDVVTRLDPKRFRIWELHYSAAYGAVGGNEAFGVSQAVGRQTLLTTIDQDPNPVVLLGFSAGAKLVGDVAAEIADGKHPHLDVRGVGLIADPARHGGQIVGQDRGGYGITGNRWISTTAFPVWQFSAPGDPISELPTGNPLRSLADLSEFWGPDQRRGGWPNSPSVPASVSGNDGGRWTTGRHGAARSTTPRTTSCGSGTFGTPSRTWSARTSRTQRNSRS